MKKFTLLYGSLLIMANTAFAGEVKTPIYNHEEYGKPAPRVNAPHDAHAKHVRQPPRMFNGFMVTGALGGLVGELDANQRVSSALDITIVPAPAVLNTLLAEQTISFANTDTMDLDFTESSLTGYLELDYGYQFRQGFWLGVGVSAGLENLKIKNTETTSSQLSLAGSVMQHGTDENTLTVEVALENDFALLFKPGYVVRHNTLIYALIGPRWGNIQTSLKTIDHLAGSIHCVNTCKWDFKENRRDSASDYEVGVTAGVGIKQMVSNYVSIGLEYAFTHYGDIDSLSTSYAHTVQFADAASLQTLDFSGSDKYDDMTLETHAVVATVSYRF